MPGQLLPSGLRISIGMLFLVATYCVGTKHCIVDRGGTFTDCVCKVPNRDDIVIKILSVDPRNYPDAPSEAIRQVLSKFYGAEIPRGSKLDLTDVGNK